MKKITQHRALLCGALVLLFATMYLVACKKEIKEDVLPPNQRNIASAIGEPDEYDEETISDFVGDIIYYKANPGQNASVECTSAVNKMEAGVNYAFSDLDTAFEDYDTTLTYTFSLTINNNDEYDMHEVAIEMYNIKDIIKDREDDYIGGSAVSRFITSSIDQGGAGNEYVVTLMFGKAYLTPPSLSDEPDVNSVASGSYVWESINHSGCNPNTTNLMQADGAAYFLALQNYYLHTTLYQPPGLQPYFDGIFPVKRSRVIGVGTYSVDFIAYDNINSSITGTFPTSMGTSSRPVAWAMFTRGIDSYVTAQPDYAPFGVGYLWFDYCMNQDYVNYYISKMPAVFDYVKPSSTAFALGGIGKNGQSNFRIGHGEASNIPGHVTYQDMWDISTIFHQYYFNYTLFRYKTNNNGYNTAY